jgi:hypothetical protein
VIAKMVGSCDQRKTKYEKDCWEVRCGELKNVTRGFDLIYISSKQNYVSIEVGLCLV